MSAADERDAAAIGSAPVVGATVRPPLLAFAPGHALTVWSADGLPFSVAGALPLLREVRPGRVQLHAGPLGLRDHAVAAAESVRRALPGVRLWLGVAWDGWVDEVAAGSVGRLLERVYLPAARAASRIGAELLVINSEAAGKAHPGQARVLACAAIDTIRRECPGLALGHTAYDHPHYHPEERNHAGRIDPDEEGYPWSAYLGGEAAAVEALEDARRILCEAVPRADQALVDALDDEDPRVSLAAAAAVLNRVGLGKGSAAPAPAVDAPSGEALHARLRRMTDREQPRAERATRGPVGDGAGGIDGDDARTTLARRGLCFRERRCWCGRSSSPALRVRTARLRGRRN